MALTRGQGGRSGDGRLQAVRRATRRRGRRRQQQQVVGTSWRQGDRCILQPVPCGGSAAAQPATCLGTGAPRVLQRSASPSRPKSPERASRLRCRRSMGQLLPPCATSSRAHLLSSAELQAACLCLPSSESDSKKRMRAASCERQLPHCHMLGAGGDQHTATFARNGAMVVRDKLTRVGRLSSISQAMELHVCRIPVRHAHRPDEPSL